MKTQKRLVCTHSMFYNQFKINYFLLGAFCIFVLLSCGSIPVKENYFYNPDPSLAQGVSKNVSISGEIKIINDQSSTEDHVISLDVTLNPVVFNYNKFTQSMVDALKMELERNGVRVIDSSEKKLYVKVTTIAYQVRPPLFNAYIEAEVKTGDDHIEFFDITRHSLPITVGFIPITHSTDSLDSAFKDIVLDIINNKQIQEYINN